jgi:ABC-2 type transport system permease protein
MKKILRRNYKWLYLSVYTFKLNILYLWNELFTSFYRFMIIISIILVAKNSNNYDLIGYLVTGSIIFAITEPYMSWEVGESIKEGKITKQLLYPSNYFVIYLFKALGHCCYIALSYFPWILFLVFTFGMQFSSDPNSYLLLLFSIPVIFIIRLLNDLIAGFGTFWFTEFLGLSYFSFNILALLGGSFFPLEYFGQDLKNILIFNPYAFTFYHPMQIYLGKYDTNQIILVYLGGIIWCLILYFFAKFIFKIGLKKNEAVGL